MTLQNGSERQVGLVAGWGDYPIALAKRLKQNGYHVVGLGIKGHADPRIADYCSRFRMVGLARVSAQIRFFRQHAVRRATMAGKIFKTRLLDRFAWLKHTPDLLFFRYFYRHFVAGTADRNDDALLMIVTDLYHDFGVEMVPATDFMPELLACPGVLTLHRPTESQQRDIDYGWRLAKEMGRLDIGQTVAVKGRAVIAVEAIEGTDACILRAGQLCSSGGFTVVKVSKPEQDMRFDVPTIGTQTIKTLKQAGAKVLAIEAGKTIILNLSEVIALANRLGIVLVAESHQNKLSTR